MGETLIGIARREKSRGAMEELDGVDVSPAAGIAGDFRGRPGDRQVTVLSREAWDTACAELGADLAWTTRRANLLVQGVDLEATTGRRLCIGSVVLEITGETDPCPRMEEQRSGLRAALEPAWRGGATCRVIHGGHLRRGDPVTWDSAE
ncbi:MAG: MOSC domain-containing protein [Myxococcota bacterium]